MAKDLNQCNFIGRLGKDPEVRQMPSGGSAANFSLACGDDYKDKKTGDTVNQTNWINVVAFGRLAEIVGEYVTKGSRIFVTGKLTVRKWQDNEGKDRWTTEVVAGNVQMLDSRESGQGGEQNQNNRGGQNYGGGNQGGSQQAGDGFDEFDESIPF